MSTFSRAASSYVGVFPTYVKSGNDFHLSAILELFKNSPDLLKITDDSEKKIQRTLE